MTSIGDALSELQLYYALRREWDAGERRRVELEGRLREYEKKYTKILLVLEEFEDAQKPD